MRFRRKPIPMSMRKLSVDDIKKVFNCVHSNEVPPEHLKFQIIVVGSNGQKLSPPPYEFEGKAYPN